MPNRQEIHWLIQSLDKAERKRFSMLSNNWKREKNYVTLYKILSSSDSYDIEKVKVLLPDVQQMHELNNFLFHRILESQRDLQKSLETELSRMLIDINFLHNKGLKNDTVRFIEKGLELAREAEAFEFELLFLRWAETYRQRFALLNSTLEEEPRQSRLVRERLKQAHEYSDLFYEADQISKKQGSFKTKEEAEGAIKHIVENPLFNSDTSKLSKSAQLDLLRTKGAIYYLLKKFEHKAKVEKELLDLLDENPAFKEAKIHFYLGTSSNLNNTLLGLGDEVGLYENLQKLADIDYKNAHYEVHKLAYQLPNWIHLYGYSENYKDLKKLEELLDKAGKDYLNYKYLFTQEAHILLTGNLALSYHHIDEMGKALHYVNLFFEDVDKKYRVDMQAFMRCFELLLHYEMGNYRLVAERAKSCRQFLIYRDTLTPVRSTFIQLTRDLSRLKSKGKSIIPKLSEHISTLQHLYETAYDPSIFSILNLVEWCEEQMKKEIQAQNKPSTAHSRVVRS